MDRNTFAHYEARAFILKALAHPTRLFLVDELSKGERCVCELTALVGADISTVSKHLAVLKNVGIVQDDKRGLQVYYHLKTPCVLNFFNCCEVVMKEHAEEKIRLAQ
jgi:DNA-binding transcriptional ArsR family regulator